MAIAQEIWDKARLLFEHGKSLNEIAGETGINKSSISKKSKTEEWEKFNHKSTLVLSEVDTILQQKKINQQKSTLSHEELNLHNIEVYKAVSKANVLNLFDNTTVKNQQAINKIQETLIQDPTTEDLLDLATISKVTEINRKQILGTTDTYKAPTELKKVKSGLGDMYKDMGADDE